MALPQPASEPQNNQSAKGRSVRNSARVRRNYSSAQTNTVYPGQPAARRATRPSGRRVRKVTARWRPPTTDEAFTASYAEQRVGSNTPPEETQPQAPPPQANATYITQPNYKQTARPTNTATVTSSEGENISMVDRMKSRLVTFWLVGWVMVFWFFLQLPAALLSLVGIAGAAALASIPDWAVDIIKSLIGVTTLENIGSILKHVLGYNPASIVIQSVADMADPANLYVFGMVIVVVVGWFFLLATYLSYKTVSLEPLSGRAHSLKMGLLLLAMIGYFLPILNLVPWVLFWILIIWRRPL